LVDRVSTRSLNGSRHHDCASAGRLRPALSGVDHAGRVRCRQSAPAEAAKIACRLYRKARLDRHRRSDSRGRHWRAHNRSRVAGCTDGSETAFPAQSPIRPNGSWEALGVIDPSPRRLRRRRSPALSIMGARNQHQSRFGWTLKSQIRVDHHAPNLPPARQRRFSLHRHVQCGGGIGGTRLGLGLANLQGSRIWNSREIIQEQSITAGATSRVLPPVPYTVSAWCIRKRKSGHAILRWHASVSPSLLAAAGTMSRRSMAD
jgi:hypothetical protein